MSGVVNEIEKGAVALASVWPMFSGLLQTYAGGVYKSLIGTVGNIDSTTFNRLYEQLTKLNLNEGW